MQIGVMVGSAADPLGVGDLVRRGKDFEARGFPTMWIPNVFGVDAITAAAVVGCHTERIELGTAVVPTYPRHPTAMAQQAITTGAACGGRFTLGIGLSHPPVIERMLGLSYARRAAHMREYMAVVRPLLRGEPARFQGEEYRVDWTINVTDAKPVPVLLAALGPQMLEIAGSQADGTITWMAGLRTLEDHIVPKLRAAAQAARRPEPRVVAGLHVVLTSDADGVRERVAQRIGMYQNMPSYRAMLDVEGTDDPSNMALVGDEKALDAGLARLRDIGVTDLEVSPIWAEEGREERTIDYLQSRL